MSTVSEQDIEKIKKVFSTINNQIFSKLKDNEELLKNLREIGKFLSKDTYVSEVELEQGVSAFNPYLFKAWERLYLFKFLNEYDLIDSLSMATLLFQNLTWFIINGTDASESCRRDTLAYRNGKIIE